MLFEKLKRREFIALLSGAAVWPLAARAHIVRSSDARPVNDTPCVGGQNHSEKSRQAASLL
jgi:hypothetical protein